MELFSRRLFAQAAKCFEKSNEPYQKRISEAYHLQEVARTIRASSNSSARLDAFTLAAKAFQSCANETQKASDAINCNRRAANCYLSAENLPLAASCYEAAGESTNAAKYYRSVGMFDRAVALAKPPDGSHSRVDPQLRDEILSVARLEFFRKDDLVLATLISFLETAL